MYVDCRRDSPYLVKNRGLRKLKQTPLLLTLAVLALIGGGYVFYEKVLDKDPIHPWDLVPAETVFVYERDICNTCIDEMKESARRTRPVRGRRA